jgi:MFS family permease
MTILDATIVNIAIPAIQLDLKVGSYAEVAWVVTGYLLAQGAVVPVTGWTTDRFGTKRPYLVAILVFTFASMACGIAQNLPELVAFRVLQGGGGGMLVPIGMTIIMRTVAARSLGRVMGIFGVPMLLAPAAGPVLGGWFVQDFSWRIIFYVNVPVGIATLIAASYFLIDTQKRRGLRIDLLGLLTSTPAVVAIMFAVNESSSRGWASWLVISLLGAATGLVTAFVLGQLDYRRAARRILVLLAFGALIAMLHAGLTVAWSSVEALTMVGTVVLALVSVGLAGRQTSEPLLQLRLFRDGTFSCAMVLSVIIATALFGGMLLVPLYLQRVLGYGALETGLFLLPQAATAALAMPLGGYLSDRIGPGWVVTLGMGLLAIGNVLLAQLHPASPTSLIIGALLLRGLAMGFAMMPSLSAALARVPRRYASRASSITNTLQRVGSSIGIAVLVTILASQVTSALRQGECAPSQALVVAASPPDHRLAATRVCDLRRVQLASATQGGVRGSDGLEDRTGPIAAFVATHQSIALSTAFDSTFALIAIVSAVGCIPALFLRKPGPPDDPTTVPPRT